MNSLEQALSERYSSIPQELRSLRQWCCSNRIKVPCQPNGKLASVTDAATWNSFDDCFSSLFGIKRTRLDWGLAFIFTADDPFAVVDLDHVRDDATEPWAVAIIDELSSYTELSKSGNGFHIVMRAVKPRGSYCKCGRVELYDRHKAMTLTGDTLLGYGTEEIREVDLTSICSRLVELDPDYKFKHAGRPNKAITANGGNGRSESEGDFFKISCCYTVIGRVRDAGKLEGEFKRRFPTEYTQRNAVKGDRVGLNYIRYSIENFLRRSK